MSMRGTTFRNAGLAWTRKLVLASRKEGWDLFNHEGVMLIEKLDLLGDFIYDRPRRFKSDGEAVVFVTQQALEGSKRHLLALYLDGRVAAKDVDVYPPLLGMTRQGKVRHGS